MKLDPIEIATWIEKTLGPLAVLWTVLVGVLGAFAWLMWRRNVSLLEARFRDFEKNMSAMERAVNTQHDVKEALQTLSQRFGENSAAIRDLSRDINIMMGRLR